MSEASRTAQIASLVASLADELAALYVAQAADLREYAATAAAGEGTVYLERTLRQREVRRADLYLQFEQAAFPESSPQSSPQSSPESM
jgi:hypothetical protein